MKRSLGDAVLIGGICLFASWTVFCHVMVSVEAGFADLMAWCFVPVIAGLVLTALCLDRHSPGVGTALETPVQPAIAPGLPSGFAWLLLGTASVTVLLQVLGAPYWITWIILVGTAGCVFQLAAMTFGTAPALVMSAWRWQRAGAVVLVVAGAVLVATTHRANMDDAQYLNFMVTALDYPAEPLFSHSGLWRDQSVPLEVPIYRFHTYELLSAALSQIFGVSHKVFYYMVLAPLLGGVAVLVHWRLAQYLVPRQAFALLLLWFVLIIALGETTRAFGNFAFVRMFQGKGPLVTIALPLCLLLGLRFAESPDWRRALALAAAVTASLGMSSSALATAPAVVIAALGGGLLNAPRVSRGRILAGGVSSLLIMAAVGMYLVVSMKIGHGVLPAQPQPSAENGLEAVLGGGILGGIVLSLFPVAPLFVAGARRRKIYAACTLIFVVALLSPWTAPLFANLFDQALQWRIFWSVPLVISAAVALIGLAAFVAGQLPQASRWAVLPTLLVAVLVASSRLSISPENKVEFGFPRYKVEPNGYALADEIVHRAPGRATIYAPVSISAWITTFRQHPYPLIVRPDYLTFGAIRQYVGLPEIDRRTRVISFLEGREEGWQSALFFARQLARDRPAIVAYERDAKTARGIARALGRAGYVGEVRGDYWLWKRPLLAMETRVSTCRVQGRSSREDLVDCIDTANPSNLPIL